MDLLAHPVVLGSLFLIVGCLLVLAGGMILLVRQLRPPHPPANGYWASVGSQHTALLERMARLETKFDVFWFRAGRDAAAALHSPEPEHARYDQLIEQFTQQGLNSGDTQEFERFLVGITTDHHEVGGRRLAAAIVLRALEVQDDVRSPDAKSSLGDVQSSDAPSSGDDLPIPGISP